MATSILFCSTTTRSKIANSTANERTTFWLEFNLIIIQLCRVSVEFCAQIYVRNTLLKVLVKRGVALPKCGGLVGIYTKTELVPFMT